MTMAARAEGDSVMRPSTFDDCSADGRTYVEGAPPSLSAQSPMESAPPSSSTAATAGSSLTDQQVHALLDILSHHETYAEIEAFKTPDAVTDYGYPFSRTMAPGLVQQPQQQQQQQQPSGGLSGWLRSATSTPLNSAPGTPRSRTPVPAADQDAASNKGSEGKTGNDDGDKDNDGGDSGTPVLQALLTGFLLPLPWLRDLPRGFWSVRVQGILARLGAADLSESYDKGALGTRKMLATGSSAVIEMLGRGALGGVPKKRAPTSGAGKDDDAGGEASSYDVNKPEDLQRAWDDVVQQLVYGDLVDDIFDHIARTDDFESHSPAVKAAAEYTLIHLAAFAHRVFIGSPEGQYLLKLLENVHSLIPYKLIKQTLRVGNAATMINGMMRLLLAKLSVTSVTNWFGITQSPDDGMNLLQRIVSLVLGWDAGEFRKVADRIEKDKASPPPPEDALRIIREHVAASREEHEIVRRASRANGQSIVVAILSSASEGGAALLAQSGGLTEEQHARCLEYYSALLSVRDREAIAAALCKQAPDLFTQAIKDLVAAYDPMIRSVHARVDIKEHLDGAQGFIDDFIRASKPTKDAGAATTTERLAGVDEYVELLRRNKGLLYRCVSAVASRCDDVWADLREWTKAAVRKFRKDEDEDGDARRSMEARLRDMFADLEGEETRRRVLQAIDAHAAYLTTLNDLSSARLQLLVTTAAAAATNDHEASSADLSSTGAAMMEGPGVYLARWQALLDDTLITPAVPRRAGGALRCGRDVKHTVAMGKTGAGGMPASTSKKTGSSDGGHGGGGGGSRGGGVEAPDVSIVVEALGGPFKELVRERARGLRGLA
ncbi:hypothetical protein JDV02_002849 [Purpureocillium takamizusanense]|uniref:Uncharacterized protein n=1 Tax=Purpureocillium takamizusanense TaxID=2060973 RepID=A0A9Q8V987_9HYPO|nr:uncharacterized protein JDV02_002849 [Purpureocillium takamizusanense]UNI16416.1 hypothetical protein JDV02_002849 [Purpureocillium takamizusanense]